MFDIHRFYLRRCADVRYGATGGDYHPFAHHPQQDIDEAQELVSKIPYGVSNNLREDLCRKKIPLLHHECFYHAVP
jgi:hypothetical protein